jgi:hypothetical protein
LKRLWKKPPSWGIFWKAEREGGRAHGEYRRLNILMGEGEGRNSFRRSDKLLKIELTTN